MFVSLIFCTKLSLIVLDMHHSYHLIKSLVKTFMIRILLKLR